jgi:O-succinylbenzoic acid--CoA ligase
MHPARPGGVGGLAVIHRGSLLEVGEVGKRARARAAELRSRGLVAGEIVLVPDDPLLDLSIMQHALAELDCGLLPVAMGNGAELTEALVEITGAEWRWVPRTGGPGELARTGLTGAGGGLPDSRLALVIGTSGSSGAPKAAMLPRRAVDTSCRLSNRHLGLRVGDIWLSCLPRHHVGGLLIGYRCALAGATVLLHEQFEARAVARDLALYGVTHISLVPAMLAQLLAVGEPPPEKLRVLLVGGQALSTALARRTVEAGWPLHVTYGMTETCSQVATSRALSAVPEEGVVGPVFPGVEVDCSGCGALPTRLRIRGPVVMAGYANPRREPGEGLEDGWFVTSDLGCRTAAGELRVLGRADDLLVIGGEPVLPAQVEERLSSAPGVASVVVVGVEDPVWGHRLIAVYAGDSSPEALDRWCRGHLGSRHRPRGFYRLDQLPVLPSGKQDRRKIRELITNEVPGGRWPA